MISEEYILKRRETLAENLSEFIKKGFLKDRGKEKYTFRAARYVNCLGDACFGLTNAQIEEYVCRQYVDNKFCKSPFGTFMPESSEKLLEEIFDFLQKTGLRISLCQQNDVLKANQRVVAIYFAKACDQPNSNEKFESKDFHFLHQKPDGTWTGKQGFERKVVHYKTLPQTLPLQKNNPYILHGVFTLTNPHICAPDVNKFEK